MQCATNSRDSRAPRGVAVELLRHLLRYETRSSMTDELWLAAVLVGLHGDTGDLRLLLEVRETDFDTGCGLSDVLEPGANADELRRWARKLDESTFGTDPSDEPVSSWTDLARDQRMTEVASMTLRKLDGIHGPEQTPSTARAPRTRATAPLSRLARDVEGLGVLPQGLRAQQRFLAYRQRDEDRADGAGDSRTRAAHLVRSVRFFVTSVRPPVGCRRAGPCPWPVR